MVNFALAKQAPFAASPTSPPLGNPAAIPLMTAPGTVPLPVCALLIPRLGRHPLPSAPCYAQALPLVHRPCGVALGGILLLRPRNPISPRFLPLPPYHLLTPLSLGNLGIGHLRSQTSLALIALPLALLDAAVDPVVPPSPQWQQWPPHLCPRPLPTVSLDALETLVEAPVLQQSAPIARAPAPTLVPS